ncbi:MAG: hypothetical protein GY755_02270, partial [Chloroflexi bacterium]|nr:hypothetical protein [Chloroflexota bacterium]
LMTPQDKDHLKKQVDILSLCAMLDINLKKTGKSYMARCPFPDHEDKNTSISEDQCKGL